jgi:dedicated sortase system histidine kinase
MASRFFSLRIKLALVSVLLFTIPVIGFWYAAQMKDYLLTAQEQAMALTARAVATILNDHPELFETNILQSFDEQKEVHAYLLNNKITLDGFTDDWGVLLGQASYFGFDNVLENYSIYEDESLNFQHLIAKRGSYYYVLFMVRDDAVVFRDPTYAGLNRSDHLQIALEGDYEGQLNLYLLSPNKSSWVNGHLMPVDPMNYVPVQLETDIQGYWRTVPGGYNIELRLPEALIKNNRISFAIADVDDPDTRQLKAVVGTSGTRQSSDLGFLLTRSPKLESILQALDRPYSRIRIIDSRHRQRAVVGTFYGEPDRFKIEGSRNGFSLKKLLDPLYAFFSDRYPEERSQSPKYLSEINDQYVNKALLGQPFTTRHSLPDSDAEIVVAGEPLKFDNQVKGAVIVEQPTNNILSVKNRVIENTINITLVVFFISTIVLFIFASRLSGRIRRLAAQTEKAIGSNGEVRDTFRASRVGDELGDLSRRFVGMMRRLKEYNRYQQKMADNLEHEIRTPVAGLSAALTNLETRLDKQNQDLHGYLAGMQDNVKRIEIIMTNIREATMLEDALRQDEQAVFDLAEALRIWVRQGYNQTFAEHSFVLQFPEEPVPVYGDPIRIRQMLDKLVGNAVDFSAVDHPVLIRLIKDSGQADITISNQGPELPAEMGDQIFESMVSIRNRFTKRPHLGLGLYVARKIAEFHGGTISAHNRVDGKQGVVVSVILPVAEVKG